MQRKHEDAKNLRKPKMDGVGILPRLKKWRDTHLSGHDVVSTMDPTGEVFILRGKMLTVCLETGGLQNAEEKS